MMEIMVVRIVVVQDHVRLELTPRCFDLKTLS